MKKLPSKPTAKPSGDRISAFLSRATEVTDKPIKERPLDNRRTRLVAIDSIHPRPGGNMRAVANYDVLKTATSLCDRGLISSLTIDLKNRLIAGETRRLAALCLFYLHRRGVASSDLEGRERIMQEVMATSILYGKTEPEPFELSAKEKMLLANLDAASFMAHQSEGLMEVLVKQIDWDTSEGRKEARALEVSENEIRRDFNPDEIPRVIQVLEDSGHTLRPGPGQDKRILPALARLLGRSERTARRVITEHKGGQNSKPAKSTSVIPSLLKQLDKLQEEVSHHKSQAAAKHVLQSVDQLANALKAYVQTHS